MPSDLPTRLDLAPNSGSIPGAMRCGVCDTPTSLTVSEAGAIPATEWVLGLLHTASLAGIDSMRLGTTALARLWHEHHPESLLPRDSPKRFAAFATAAADLYAAITHDGQPFSEVDPEELLGDLIADLCHLAAARGTEPEEVLDRARNYFSDEPGL